MKRDRGALNFERVNEAKRKPDLVCNFAFDREARHGLRFLSAFAFSSATRDSRGSERETPLRFSLLFFSLLLLFFYHLAIFFFLSASPFTFSLHVFSRVFVDDIASFDFDVFFWQETLARPMNPINLRTRHSFLDLSEPARHEERVKPLYRSHSMNLDEWRARFQVGHQSAPVRRRTEPQVPPSSPEMYVSINLPAHFYCLLTISPQPFSWRNEEERNESARVVVQHA